MFDGNSGWRLRIRVWVECEGVKILGPGRVELLKLIDRHRSISAAAKQMKMSYRRAWRLVQAVNAAAGEPAVEATSGDDVHGVAESSRRPFDRAASRERMTT